MDLDSLLSERTNIFHILTKHLFNLEGDYDIFKDNVGISICNRFYRTYLKLSKKYSKLIEQTFKRIRDRSVWLYLAQLEPEYNFLYITPEELVDIFKKHRGKREELIDILLKYTHKVRTFFENIEYIIDNTYYESLNMIKKLRETPAKKT